MLSQLSLDFCRQGVPTLWGSFEISNVRLARTMLSQYAECDLTTSVKNGTWDLMSEEFGQLPLYFLDFYGSTEISAVLDAMEYSVYVHDVEHIVLDDLQFMTSSYTGRSRGSDFTQYDVINRAIELFRKFATAKVSLPACQWPI